MNVARTILLYAAFAVCIVTKNCDQRSAYLLQKRNREVEYCIVWGRVQRRSCIMTQEDEGREKQEMDDCKVAISTPLDKHTHGPWDYCFLYKQNFIFHIWQCVEFIMTDTRVCMGATDIAVYSKCKVSPVQDEVWVCENQQRSALRLLGKRPTRLVEFLCKLSALGIQLIFPEESTWRMLSDRSPYKNTQAGLQLNYQEKLLNFTFT